MSGWFKRADKTPLIVIALFLGFASIFVFGIGPSDDNEPPLEAKAEQREQEAKKTDEQLKEERQREVKAIAGRAARQMVRSLAKHADYNPDSFELEDYKWVDLGDKIQVRINYTAKNAFNSVVRHSLLLALTPNGEPIEIVEHR